LTGHFGEKSTIPGLLYIFLREGKQSGPAFLGKVRVLTDVVLGGKGWAGLGAMVLLGEWDN